MSLVWESAFPLRKGLGTRIAAPVCALARNDIVGAMRKREGRFHASFYSSVICFSSLSSGFTSAPAAGMVRVR